MPEHGSPVAPAGPGGGVRGLEGDGLPLAPAADFFLPPRRHRSTLRATDSSIAGRVTTIRARIFGPNLLAQVPMDRADRHRALANRPGDALHRPVAHVARREHARNARLEW